MVNKAFYGENYLSESNDKGMKKKDGSYEITDHRGHIQASSQGGSNSIENITPQSRNVNQIGYRAMERGETAVLKSGGSVYSEKIAYASNQPGYRPDAYIVNDTVTYADGRTQNVHTSYTNLQYDEQTKLENEFMRENADMLDAYENPGDTLRESMDAKEYTSLMEETDNALPGVKDMYDNGWITSKEAAAQNGAEPSGGEMASVENSEAEVSAGSMNDGGMSMGDN